MGVERPWRLSEGTDVDLFFLRLLSPPLAPLAFAPAGGGAVVLFRLEPGVEATGGGGSVVDRSHQLFLSLVLFLVLVLGVLARSVVLFRLALLGFGVGDLVDSLTGAGVTGRSRRLLAWLVSLLVVPVLLIVSLLSRFDLDGDESPFPSPRFLWCTPRTFALVLISKSMHLLDLEPFHVQGKLYKLIHH